MNMCDLESPEEIANRQISYKRSNLASSYLKYFMRLLLFSDASHFFIKTYALLGVLASVPGRGDVPIVIPLFGASCSDSIPLLL